MLKLKPATCVEDLNPEAIRVRNMGDEDVKNVLSIHKRIQKVFDNINNEDNPAALRNLAQQVESLDYELQDAWKFGRDIKYHYWWVNAPKCKCNYENNMLMDDMGRRHRFIAVDCPLHGYTDTISKEEKHSHIASI